MRTLAVECATKTVSLALLEAEEVRAEVCLNLGGHHAEILLPAIEALFRLAGMAPECLDLLACTVGPGSFTGLRIGASTVKGLSLALSKPIVGVSTLEALAMNVMPTPLLICPLLDARRDQVYTGLYRMGAGGLPEALREERLTDIGSFLEGVGDEGVLFIGDGAVRHEKQIAQRLGERAILAGRSRQNPRAGAVGLIALRRYQNGQILDTLRFAPRYLRPSEAEAKNAIQTGRQE
jgi:tRNA threonylcarbamoyladenosine biosynthesis protein TsaB